MRAKLLSTKNPGVYRRKSDGRLVAWVGVKSDKTGKKTFRSRLMPENATVADTRKLAEELRDMARALTESVRPPSLVVYAATWIARKLARKEWTVGAATQANVECHFALHIVPVLGDYLLDKITPLDLQRWIDAQVAKGSKMSSLRSHWVTLKNVLADGCNDYGLRCPAERVKLPKGASTTRGGKDLALTPEQVRNLLNVARKDSPHMWYPMLMLGFSTGARPGELVAVKVSDLDLRGEIGKWQVAQHWVAGTIVEGTKLHQEGRPSHLDPQTTAVLRTLVERRKADGGEAGWLFPAGGKAAGSGRCVTEQGLWNWLQVRARSLGIPALSGKTFRQTHITLSSLAGVKESLVMAQVGHNNPQVHAIYNRPPEEPRQDAVRKLSQMMYPEVTPPVGPRVGPDVCYLEID